MKYSKEERIELGRKIHESGLSLPQCQVMNSNYFSQNS